MENIKENSKRYCVYAHINNENQKIYIGITSQKPEKRWINGKGYFKNTYFTNAIQKYGWDNFEHIILIEDLSQEQSELIEIDLIAKYKTTNRKYGYNICKGGEGASGHIVSEEQKKNISKSKMGNTYMLGKHQSDEVKQQISKAQKGKIISEEHKDIIRKSNQNRIETDETKEKRRLSMMGNTHMLGKHLNDDAKEKIREKATGRKLSDEAKSKISKAHKGKHYNFGRPVSEKCIQNIKESLSIKVVQLSLLNEIIKVYNSISDAERELCIDSSSISKCCKNKAKTAGGFRWMYYNE